MIMDYNLILSNAQDLSGAGSVASTSYIDMSGGTLFNAGNATNFGQDVGVGSGVNVPKVVFQIGVAFTTATSVNFQIQGSVDNSTYTTYIETGAVLIANLTVGAMISVDLPRRIFGASLPRYLRAYYVIAGSNPGAGTVTSAVVLTPGIWDGGVYPSNFTVAA